MSGATIDWSAAAGDRTIYTAPPDIDSLVVMEIIARKPVGLQPLTMLVKINGQTWGLAITLLTLTGNNAQRIPLATGGLTPVLKSLQTISVTPVALAAGSQVFDVVGYFT